MNKTRRTLRTSTVVVVAVATSFLVATTAYATSTAWAPAGKYGTEYTESTSVTGGSDKSTVTYVWQPKKTADTKTQICVQAKGFTKRGTLKTVPLGCNNGSGKGAGKVHWGKTSSTPSINALSGSGGTEVVWKAGL